MIIEMNCPFCNAEHNVKVQMNDWFNYVNGMTVQEAFPYLSATERKQLISQMCPSCQEKIFS
jgi:hypothetical protein